MVQVFNLNFAIVLIEIALKRLIRAQHHFVLPKNENIKMHPSTAHSRSLHNWALCRMWIIFHQKNSTITNFIYQDVRKTEKTKISKSYINIAMYSMLQNCTKDTENIFIHSFIHDACLASEW
jgi:hypothetical protein